MGGLCVQIIKVGTLYAVHLRYHSCLTYDSFEMADGDNVEELIVSESLTNLAMEIPDEIGYYDDLVNYVQGREYIVKRSIEGLLPTVLARLILEYDVIDTVLFCNYQNSEKYAYTIVMDQYGDDYIEMVEGTREPDPYFVI